jgi:hypothetical protein
MQVTIPHKFTQADAVARVKAALDDARPKLAGQATLNEERWDGDVLHFDIDTHGQHIVGTLTVEEHDFNLQATLPLMLRMFEGKIEKAIIEQTQRVLG